MATQAELEKVIADVSALRVDMQEMMARFSTGAGVACTPALPHDELVWNKGTQQYLCRKCSNVYRKDGRGGLLEVT